MGCSVFCPSAEQLLTREAALDLRFQHLIGERAKIRSRLRIKQGIGCRLGDTPFETMAFVRRFGFWGPSLSPIRMTWTWCSFLSTRRLFLLVSLSAFVSSLFVFYWSSCMTILILSSFQFLTLVSYYCHEYYYYYYYCHGSFYVVNVVGIVT